ncbi:MAG: hypothetical protein JWL66_2613 [Sphingomonadales bacterium]|jgi:hypothetical protein|nr:hypothetical protein [Sphingomonadales bacterium]
MADSNRQLEFYSRRERQEREAEAAAACPVAKAAHAEMARLYAGRKANAIVMQTVSASNAMESDGRGARALQAY